jgi:GH15 family glucan-1,4-alpha-glucosidase
MKEVRMTTAEAGPIAGYGMLSDCNSSALVDRWGSIDWLCVPRYDSRSVFARILDPNGGHWHIRPIATFEESRRYLPGTLVLETTFHTADGEVRVLDGMLFALEQEGHDPGMNAPHELVRVVECVSGTVEMDLMASPRPEYGLNRPALVRRDDGTITTFGGPDRFTFHMGVPVEVDGADIRARFNVSDGETHAFSMAWAYAEAGNPQPLTPEAVPARLADTIKKWEQWEDAHSIYEGPHSEQVRLSSRVLKGLMYRPTGAIVAAPTTSLPETVGGERNWDYRYTWVRDASLTLGALYIGACSDEAHNFVMWLAGAAGAHVHLDDPLQIMYGIAGERDLTERVLPHLRGWRDSRPVRIGNGAWTQTQLDVYGEFLDAFWLYVERVGEIDDMMAHFIEDLADAAMQQWRKKDQGLWEMRGSPRHHLSSKVLCWTALDRAVKLAGHIGREHRVKEWENERDEIRNLILTRGWSEKRQAFAQAFDSDELDASALLMPIVDFLPANDPHMLSTINAINRDLTEDGMVLRYRVEESDDGLTGEEGTFVICSFWLVSCLARAGEMERAEALFDNITSYANDLGLLAEEIDTTNGELLGNFPQAFSHIGLITAAWDLDRQVVEGAPSTAPR